MREANRVREIFIIDEMKRSKFTKNHDKILLYEFFTLVVSFKKIIIQFRQGEKIFVIK